MLRESRVPHLVAWAVAEARRLRLAVPEESADGAPPAPGAAPDGALDSIDASQGDPPAVQPLPPQSGKFLVEWQIERP